MLSFAMIIGEGSISRRAGAPRKGDTWRPIQVVGWWLDVEDDYLDIGRRHEQDEVFPDPLAREGFRELVLYNLPLERIVESVEVIRFRPRRSRRCFIGLHSYLSA